MTVNDSIRERAVQIMANGNMSLGEMADELGISDSTFYRLRQDPEFQNELRKEIRSRFAPYAQQAVNNIITLANCADSESVKLSANKEILEKIGVNNKQELEISGTQDITVDIVNDVD